VITDGNEVLALGRDDTIGRVFDSVTGTAVLIDTTLNTDVVRVYFGLERTVTTIGQVDDDKSRANKRIQLDTL
jgi:urease beta subunit